MAKAIRVIAVEKVNVEGSQVMNAMATVEIFGVQKQLKAYIPLHGENAVVYGVAVKYRTGEKVWKGNFTYWFASGNINGVHAPMQHNSRIASVSIVGFYDDFAEKVQSQHFGN